MQRAVTPALIMEPTMALEKNTTLMTEIEAAGHLKITPRCLQDWRKNQRGPAWIKVGRRIRYRLQDIENWLLDQRQDTQIVSQDFIR